MPKGFAQIEAAAQKIKEKGGGDFDPILFLKLPNDGDTAVVRFLEQGDEVYGYWYHDFTNIDPQTGWRTKIPCLDQDDEGVPCPGCREDLPRKFEGLINIIWRNAPKFKRDSDGKVVRDNNDKVIIDGTEDQVAVWRGGIRLFSKVLKRKDHAFKGLSTRDFEVVREGTGLDTTYSVEPSDPDVGASDISEEDAALAADKYDLEKVARFVDADEFDNIIATKMNGHGADDTDDIREFLNDSPYRG